jgi:type VI secretion system Hcp family effector
MILGRLLRHGPYVILSVVRHEFSDQSESLANRAAGGIVGMGRVGELVLLDRSSALSSVDVFIDKSSLWRLDLAMGSAVRSEPILEGDLVMSFQYYTSVKGSKQGQFKSETKNPRRKDKWIELVAFEMGSAVPIDHTGGGATGRRTHAPLTITKEFGAASPQLLEAHWKNEILSEVIIETVGKPKADGSENVVRRIILTNAVIVDIRPHVGREAIHGKVLSDLTFTFQKVEQELVDKLAAVFG